MPRIFADARGLAKTLITLEKDEIQQQEEAAAVEEYGQGEAGTPPASSTPLESSPPGTDDDMMTSDVIDHTITTTVRVPSGSSSPIPELVAVVEDVPGPRRKGRVGYDPVLRQQLAARDLQLSELDGSLVTANRESDGLRRELKSLEVHSRALAQKRELETTQVETLKSLNGEMQQRLEDMISELAQSDLRLRAAEVEVAAKRREVHHLQTELTTETNVAETTQQELEIQEKELSRWREMLQQIQPKVKDIQHVLERKRATHEDADGELRTALKAEQERVHLMESKVKQQMSAMDVRPVRFPTAPAVPQEGLLPVLRHAWSLLRQPRYKWSAVVVTVFLASVVLWLSFSHPACPHLRLPTVSNTVVSLQTSQVVTGGGGCHQRRRRRRRRRRGTVLHCTIPTELPHFEVEDSTPYNVRETGRHPSNSTMEHSKRWSRDFFLGRAHYILLWEQSGDALYHENKPFVQFVMGVMDMGTGMGKYLTELMEQSAMINCTLPL